MRGPIDIKGSDRSGTSVIIPILWLKPKTWRIFDEFEVILSCDGHEIKQPMKFLVLIRTTDLIGPLIW